jgi:phage gp36-like protein
MLYISMSDLTGKIPGPFLIQALDDDGDGVASAAEFEAVAKDACGKVDSLLSGRYQVPFSNPLPAVVRNAAVTFACYQVHQRRSVADKDNPFASEARTFETKLAAIAKGEEELDPKIKRANPSATAITAPAKTVSSTGIAA